MKRAVPVLVAALLFGLSPGSVANETVRGCGAKTADHPLLLWAFTEKRLVYLTVDPNNCFSNVLIGAPT